MIEVSTSYTHKLITHFSLTLGSVCMSVSVGVRVRTYVGKRRLSKKNACHNFFHIVKVLPHKDALLVIHLFKPTILISSYLIFIGPFIGETQ